MSKRSKMKNIRNIKWRYWKKTVNIYGLWKRTSITVSFCNVGGLSDLLKKILSWFDGALDGWRGRQRLEQSFGLVLVLGDPLAQLKTKIGLPGYLSLQRHTFFRQFINKMLNSLTLHNFFGVSNMLLKKYSVLKMFQIIDLGFFHSNP